MSRLLRQILPPLGVAAIAIAGYFPALNGGFVWDDDSWTTNIEPLLRDASGLVRMWTSTAALQQYFPLTGTTFWLDHHCWGTWTLPYHVENLALHLLAALLSWKLLSRLRVPGAGFAAALFAVHPLMVESVAWITERKNVLSMALMLVATFAYARSFNFWRDEHTAPFRWRSYALAGVFFALALLSKASVFAFPAIVLVIIWWRRGTLDWKRDVVPALPFLCVSAGFSIFIAWLEVNHTGADGTEWPIALEERPLVAGRAIFFYAGKLLWPAGLHPIYPRWDLNANSWLQWMPPIAVLITLPVLWLLSKRIGRAPLATALIYCGTLFPTLGFLNVYGMNYSFVADRWAYLASLPFFALIAATAVRLTSQRAWLFVTMTSVVLSGLTFLTMQKAAQYRDAKTLMRAALAGNPRCWLACFNLANDLASEGQTDEALALYQRAVDIWPGYAKAHTNYGSLLLRVNRDEEALQHLQQALDLHLPTGAVHHNIGLYFLKQNRYEDALTSFGKAVELTPSLTAAHQNLGVLLSRKGDTEGAIRQLQIVAKQTPDDPAAQRNLASVFAQARQMRGVIACLERLIEINPHDSDALNNLASILAISADDSLRDGPRALRLATLADVLAGNKNAAFVFTLAAAHAECGQFTEAVEVARRGIDLAAAANQINLASALREALHSFEAGRPLRDASLGSAP